MSLFSNLIVFLSYLVSKTWPTITSVYVRTSTGIVRAHVESSLMSKGVTPCVFVFDDPIQKIEDEEKAPVQEKMSLSNEKHYSIKGAKDVFLPQLEDIYDDPGKVSFFVTVIVAITIIESCQCKIITSTGETNVVILFQF